MSRRAFDNDELHWYAIDVVRQKEYVAGHIFNRKGWMTFIPTETRFRKKSRYCNSKLEVAHPEIPGVVFVGFPGAPDWFCLRNIHLVNGFLSIDDRPRRIDTAGKEWLTFRGYRADGRLTVERHKVMVKIGGEQVEIERSVPLISVQGRGVLRSSLDMKAKAASDRPIVIRAAGERARLLGDLLRGGNAQPDSVAA